MYHNRNTQKSAHFTSYELKLFPDSQHLSKTVQLLSLRPKPHHLVVKAAQTHQKMSLPHAERLRGMSLQPIPLGQFPRNRLAQAGMPAVVGLPDGWTLGPSAHRSDQAPVHGGQLFLPVVDIADRAGGGGLALQRHHQHRAGLQEPQSQPRPTVQEEV